MGHCQSRHEKRGIVVPSSSSNNAALDTNNESSTIKGKSKSGSRKSESSSKSHKKKHNNNDKNRGRSREKGDNFRSYDSLRKLSPAPSKSRKNHTTKIKPGLAGRGDNNLDHSDDDSINNPGGVSSYSADSDEEWRLVCLKHVKNIIDPEDFISAVDECVSSITNKLSPTELLRIQRHTRSILREFKSDGKSSGSTYGKSMYYKDNNSYNSKQRLIDEPVFRKIFSSGDVHVKEIVDIVTKRRKEESLRLMAFNDAVAAAEKEYLSDTDCKSVATIATASTARKKEKKERASSYFSKLKPTINTNHSSNNLHYSNMQQYKIDDADIVSEQVDILGSAYLLLAFMSSEGVLEYVASLADNGLNSSGLDLNTMHLFNDNKNAVSPSILSILSGSIVTNGKNNSLSTADLQQPLGLTYGALCAFLGMAFRGSREQKICLLFHLLIPPKLLKLALTARGLFPTWLLEIDSDIVLSIYSLIYFYYKPSTKPIQSSFPLWPMKISARIGVDILSMLMSSSPPDQYYDNDSVTKDIAPQHNTPNGMYGQNQSTHETNVSTIAETSDDFLLVEDNNTTTTSTDNNNHNQENFESATPNLDVTWTYTEFESWANISLTDDNLDVIFYKLFGDKILLRPRMELESVKERWMNWEKTDLKYWQHKANKYNPTYNTHNNNGSFSDSFSYAGNEGKDEIDDDDTNINDVDKNNVGFFAKLFYGSNFTSSTSNITATDTSSNHHTNNNNHNLLEDESKNLQALQAIKSEVFGGLGGIDGKGGLGFGLMYCIDKYWWDHWTKYTNWTWKQQDITTYKIINTKKETEIVRKPGEINNEILLEPHDSPSGSNIVRGTMGSYDIMKSSCQKDIDYVLIPPPVWDLLYELYGGGPPIPRMVAPPKKQQQQVNDNGFIVEQQLQQQDVLIDNNNNVGNEDGNDNVQIFFNIDNNNNSSSMPLQFTNALQESCCADSTRGIIDGSINGNDEDTSNEEHVEVVVKSEEEINNENDDIIVSSSSTETNNTNTASSYNPVKVPSSFFVMSHPWIINCQICDPHQPYRRGDAGTLSIHIMTTPDQPLWRFFAEIVFRLPVHHPKVRDSNGRGKARLWKRDDAVISSSSSPVSPANSNSNTNASSSTSSRYGPWSLLCKNRFASIPVPQLNEGHNRNRSLTDILPENNNLSLKEFIRDWEAYTDHATVESVGLSDGTRVMLEYALVSKNGAFSWPREAAAKAGRARRLVEEDASFRRWLRDVDIHGNICKPSPPLEGTTIDAMDPSGRWYQAVIVQVDKLPPLHSNITVNNELLSVNEDEDVGISSEHSASLPAPVAGENHRVLVDFSDVGGAEDWIRVDSDRLACAGRFTIDSLKTLDIESDDQSVASSTILPSSDSTSKLKLTTAASRKLGNALNDSSTISSEITNTNGSGFCPFPGYGACGLSNLGNTCYANAALQCISYIPLLRCYLLSGMYRADINRDNPLGTGGKLLEEYADLLRILWSGKFSSRAPTKFRSQLGKARSQFSANDQQDAQELLNAMLDALHEDSSKIKKKPLVPPLDDAWVVQNSVPRVGLEAWRRYLRRNRSIIAHIAYGQVLNRVTCPVCNHSSLNFDPFNMLSLPFPTISEVNFRCIVVRRGTALNCPRTLIRKRKDSISSNDENSENKSIHSALSTDSLAIEDATTPPSDRLIMEEYIVSMSRLADISDLKLRLQNYCGISANCLKLGKAEEIITNNDLPANNPLRSCVNVTALPDNQGPCSQLAKLPVTCNDTGSTLVTAPILLMAFESTLRPRPPVLSEEDDTDSTEEEVNSSQDGDTACLSTIEEGKLPSLSTNVSVEGSNHSKSSNKRQRALETQLQLYGDYQECSIFDTDPTPLSKAMSRILWPKTAPDFKLGLRVDAIDHRNHWYPGTVVEIIETEDHQPKKEPKQQWKDEGEPMDGATKVRIHFDNFSSKWDEIYGIENFHRGQVRPLYSHATARNKPLEFLVHHRHGIISNQKSKPPPTTDDNSNSNPAASLFGQSFFLQCHSEWSTARAGAHILAQASRFLQSYYPQLSTPDSTCNGSVHKSETEDSSVSSSNIKRSNSEDTYKALEDARSVIADIIRVLVEIDRKYVKCALSLGRYPNDQYPHRSSRSLRNPSSFNATSMTMSLSKKLSTLLPRLPFEVRVCAAESPLGGYGNSPTDEVTFPFSLVRTIGNYMNARLAIVLHWHASCPESPSSASTSSRGRLKTNAIQNNNKPPDGSLVLYSTPIKHIHKESHSLLAESASEDSNSDNHQNKTARNRKKGPCHGGMHLGVCLTEFCKEQQLPEGWKCPKCKVDREGQQSMKLWRLPDLLTFHIKRFNCSARWREKISTKVNFPLTGLDLGEWCDLESPALSSGESNVYDLIGVINHLGGMTGGHYVAVCKATQCGTDGSEEVAHSFNGYGVSCYETEEETVQTGWRLGRSREKDSASSAQRAAVASSRNLSRSSEPLWLQFDDDLVEPIPPRAVVSEGAYVLFYRRRRLTPSNIAKYSTPD